MPLKTLVLIPAYNEEANITVVIEGILRNLPGAEILAVNDGSNDRTREMALRAGAAVISHPYNLGYGATLQTGYRYALQEGYDAVVQMDGDGQHDPSCIGDLLDALRPEETDLVIGSRFLRTGERDPDFKPYRPPWMRRLGMGLFRMMTSVIVRQEVTDPTSGYQAMNRRVLEWASGVRFPVDYPDADVIIMLHRSGFRIREVPVRMFESRDKKSMHSGWKPIYYVFKMLLSILVTLMRKP
jgi:glycosyltransferase involved in cell wall biosynthesis